MEAFVHMTIMDVASPWQPQAVTPPLPPSFVCGPSGTGIPHCIATLCSKMQHSRKICLGLYYSVPLEAWRHLHNIFKMLKDLSITYQVVAWEQLNCSSAQVEGFLMGVRSQVRGEGILCHLWGGHV